MKPNTKAMEQAGVSRQQAISLLTKSTHGKLKDYVEVGLRVSEWEPDFLAHLIAWNQQKGVVRDSKVALPVLSLHTAVGRHWNESRNQAVEWKENALAHLALLDPRNLVRAIRFRREIGGIGKHRLVDLVERYLRAREGNWSWWERTALQHRQSMKELYALAHVKPSTMADAVLFKREFTRGTVFGVVRELKEMSAAQAASEIISRRIPFLIAQGALGEKAKDVDLQLALIKRMTSTELVTNIKTLERWGVKNSPVTRAALEEALDKAAGSKSKKQVLKTTRAAGAQTDGKLKAKLESLQERQLGRGSVEGNWLVLGDRSPSMGKAIQVSREVSAILARSVSGSVWLVFFDGTPAVTFDCTGATYDQIIAKTQGVRAGGQGTSIGCGLRYALEKGWPIDGIAIVSDAKENTAPAFATAYGMCEQKLGKQPPVYLYRVQPGITGYGDHDLAQTMQAAGHEMQEFDLRGSEVDYHSLPNLVQTMRTNRYSLVDEIMESRLLTVDEVLKRKTATAGKEIEQEVTVE